MVKRGGGKKGEKRQRKVGEEILRFNTWVSEVASAPNRNKEQALKHIFLHGWLAKATRGQCSVQEVLAASEAGLFSYAM